MTRNRRVARGAAARLALAAGVFWMVIGACVAQAGEPEGERSLAERDVLTGTWGGARTSLAERGVEIGIANYGDLMPVVSGGIRRHTYYAGLFEPTFSLDLDKMLGLAGARIFVRGIGTYGTDPADGTGSVQAPSNLANGVDTFKFFEAWFEQRFLDDKLAVLAGLYAADTEFDVKETAGVFINGGFGTGPDLSESGSNGPCIFPTSCAGVRVRYQPTSAQYVQLAVLDGVAGNPNNPYGTHVRLARDDGALILAEVGHQRTAEEGWFFRAALGGWHYTTSFDHVSNVDPEGNPQRVNGTQGVYALLESALFQEPGETTRGLSGFLRVGGADPNVNPIQYSASAGLVYTGLFPGRAEDLTGLGVSAAFLGSKYRNALRAELPVDAAEVVLELTHWMPVFPWLAVQFDLQYIFNPGFDPAVRNALVLGLRHKITF